MRAPRRHRLHALRALVGALTAAVVAFGAAGCSDGASAGQITVAGSTTCLPIAESVAEGFEEETGVNVLVSGLGSSAGIEAVSAGTADIASSSRYLTVDEQQLGLTPIVIAHDGIAVIVNEDNPIESLTVGQLRAIYSGAITNWSQVGGNDGPIQLVNRDEASGTREAFKSMVMASTPFDRSAAVLQGTGQVRDVVSRSEGAIGYISMGFVESKFASTTVKAIKVEGIAPTEETVSTGEYPISRDRYFFVNGEPSPDAKAYIDYMLDPERDDLIREAGFVPVDHDAQTEPEE